jgi:hypothetical protein
MTEQSITDLLNECVDRRAHRKVYAGTDYFCAYGTDGVGCMYNNPSRSIELSKQVLNGCEYVKCEMQTEPEFRGVEE